MITGHEHRMGAEPSSLGRGHGRTDPVTASHIARRSNHPSVSGTANDQRGSTKIGTPQQLTGGKERIHVDMDKAQRPVGRRTNQPFITHQIDPTGT